MANLDGHFYGIADASKPTTARPDSGKSVPVDASLLYLPSGRFPSWFGDLLDVEQYIINFAAMVDYTPVGKSDC